ncbi:SCO family protein [Mariniflexile litorale]|uniref:SCO family protein n=1 Tax=Mariniflexile litorale TaxID=3045158 RepID=A0AAU7EF23_9FLAO|nr:SCO family protein [Mariniflexile sp. KMM 9835]MDQ8212266.1 SCO family protein [Mariniflexile sp. KMM 9835]
MNRKKYIVPEFDSDTLEEDIAAFVDQADKLKKRTDVLGLLLVESHPLYKERGTNEVNRIQGYILASFEKYGFSLKLLPIALEALESGMSAYIVAASAKAIRGLKRKNPRLVYYLLAGINNIYYRDDTITFNSYKPKWPLEHPTSALKEILLTLQWLGANARDAIVELEVLSVSIEINSNNRKLILETIEKIQRDKNKEENCCNIEIESPINVSKVDYTKIKGLIIQDQDGEILTYGDFFRDKPTVLVFFYTRCENHNKCSLTINKLGKLQQLLKKLELDQKIKTAAMSYDPIFDTPERLKTYALKRHVSFDYLNRVFRVKYKQSMPQILNYFKSEVNYAGNLINKHLIELHIIDELGRPIKSYNRFQWEPEDVVNNLLKYLSKKPKSSLINTFRLQKIGGTLRNIIVPILIAFFPKCPLCWTAYLSVFGISGMSSIPYKPWILPILCVILFINLWFIWRRSNQTKSWIAFYLAIVGTIILILFGPIYMKKPILNIGLVLLITAALLNSIQINILEKIRNVAS